MTKGQTTIYKTLHRKLNIINYSWDENHNCHFNRFNID